MTIDIMMPFYGSPDLLRQAVRSVLAQTDDDWRLTIIDDCYPDRAPGEWVQSIDDSRVAYLRNEQNLGVSRNFQRSIDLAEREFMVIMGCDDIMLPGYVRWAHNLAVAFPDASYLQPGVQVIDSNGLRVLPLADRIKRFYRFRISQPTRFSGERLARNLLRGNWTYFPSICWRTAVMKKHGFRPDLHIALDFALQLQIVADGAHLIVDTEETFQYRRHSASASSIAAADGSRFTEELTVFRMAERIMASQRWKCAARAARHHYSSRLNAISQLPGALSAHDRARAKNLIGYALSSGWR
jgi:glycosyltransferase involved in cell wall biosynthesis